MRFPFWLRASLAALACAAVVYLLTFMLKPRFKASETLYFPMSQADSGASPLAALKGQAGGDAGTVQSLGGALSSPLVGSSTQTAIGLITSRSCLRPVAEENRLAEAYGVSEGEAIKILKGRLQASVDKNGFLVLEIDDENAERAAKILESVRKKLTELSSSLTVNVSRTNRKFIEGRVAEYRILAAAKKEALSRSIASRPLSDLESTQKRYLEVRKEAEEAKIRVLSANAQIQASERDMKHLLAQSESFPGKLIAVNALYQNLQGLTQEMQKRRLDLEDASTAFTSGSAELRSARRNATTAESVASSLLTQQKANLAKGLEPTLMAAKAELASLRTAATRYERLSQQFGQDFQSATSQYADVELARKEFEGAQEQVARLEGELELARIAEARDPSRFEVVDPAEPTGEQTYPRRALLAGVVFVLALAIQAAPRMLSSLRA